MAQSINQALINDFMRSGAFLRHANGEIFLWIGPWQSGAEKSQNHLQLQEFFAHQGKIFFAKHFVENPSQSELLQLIESSIQATRQPLQRSDFSRPKFENFLQSFHEIQGRIQRQEIEKAVPCSFVYSEKKPHASDRLRFLANLLKAPLGLYAYGFWNEEEGILGATPEILFSRDGQVLQSMALAGTMAKSADVSAKNLLRSEKDLHEHQVVVQDLDVQLRKLGWVKKGDLQVIELPTLYHLMTPFQVEIGQKTDEEIIRLLHPTPALGVHPRGFGYHWLVDLPEQKGRKIFGAPILFRLNSNQSVCLVAIRNLQWNSSGSQIGAGCGLVQASQIEFEWQEIQNKLNAIFLLLGIE